MSESVSIGKKISWRVEYLAYRGFELVLGLFPIERVFRFGELLGSVMCRFSPRYRAIVRRNLMVALSSDAELAEPTAQQVEAVFRRNGGNMLTSLVAGKLKQEELKDHLEVVGMDQFVAALEESGAILMLAHMGNWEMLTKFTQMLSDPPPMGALYRPLNNPHVNELVLKSREAAGMTLVSSKNPAFALLRILRKKGIVSILSDQRIGGRGDFCSFFGVATPCTRLPYLLHEKTAKALFSVKMETLAPAKWRLTFTRFESGTQQEAFDALAVGMQSSSADCFWFQDRWQVFPTLEELKEVEACHSDHFPVKRLRCILESRSILEEFPELGVKLASYDLIFADEGGCPTRAYCAVGEEGGEFYAKCKKNGLKRGFKSVKKALAALEIK